MRKVRACFLRFLGSFDKQRQNRELDEEIESHLQFHIEDNLRLGMTPYEARREALIKLGGIESTKEACRDQRGLPVLEGLWQDIRYGARMLRRSPGFTTVAVLTLTLGIGGTTAIFSVVYAVVLRPLPFSEPERLVAIWTRTPQVERLPMAPANHRDLKSQSSAFEDIAMMTGVASYNLTGDGEPERLLATGIAANLFPLLGVKPILGRGFVEEENQPGRDRVVILSHGLWQRRYAGDPRVLGKTIQLENMPHTVVGVMKREFQDPTQDVQIWTPLTVNPDDFRTRTGFGYRAVGRLKPGITLEQTRADVNLIATRLAKQYPVNRDVRFTVTPLRQDISAVARKPLLVLLGAAVGLLLIGCCNLVNLLLARALARSRETAVRLTLGATRFRLIHQAAAELLLILAFGAFAGVLAAKGGIHLMLPWLPAALPRVAEIEMNLPVLVFSGTILFITATLVLLVPAMQSARIDLGTALRDDSRTLSATRSRAMIRNLLVVGQVALTMILLTAAGLLIRTFTALKDVDPGFHPQGVLSLQLAIPRHKYDSDDKVMAFCQRILERVRAVPGVEAAGMLNRLPLTGSFGLSTIEFERANQNPGALEGTDETVTTPDYFRAMGIAVRQGRTFTEQDTGNAPLVAVVDEQVARLAWPGQSPIGKRVRGGPHRPWAEVVGVVRHVRHERLESDRRLQIYWNYLQRPKDQMTLVVRTPGDAQDLVKPVFGAIRAVDPDQPAYAVRTMTDVIAGSLSLRWFNTVVVSVFAGASLFLALIGIYGVMAWNVSQRTREIGIRMALGARRSSVLALVLRAGLKLVGAGIVIGLAGALLLTRLLRSLLFGVGPTDPLTFLLLPVLLLAVALLACWLPGRRAAKVDPMVALRYE